MGHHVPSEKPEREYIPPSKLLRLWRKLKVHVNEQADLQTVGAFWASTASEHDVAVHCDTGFPSHSMGSGEMELEVSAGVLFFWFSWEEKMLAEWKKQNIHPPSLVLTKTNGWL